MKYGFLPKGDLPPLEERLPEEPLVVVPYDEVGNYGGRLSGASIAPEAGNSEWLSVRHVNLLRFADDLQTIVPNMAKSFEWNSDYTELTVTLRKGHKWSDGQPFTSEDIVFWWDDIVMNKDLYPDVPSYWVYGGEPMQVEAVDRCDRQVQVCRAGACIYHASGHHLHSRVGTQALPDGQAPQVQSGGG